MEKKAVIYVSLDALFDTRLATLHRLNPELSQKILVDGYFNRIVDSFEEIDRESFEGHYQKRDQITLSNSMVTRVPEILNFFTDKTLKARVSTPFIMQPVVHINIHPYVLPDEAITSIVQGVKIMTRGMCDIEVINEPLESITPFFAKKSYVAMVMYDYWNWLEIHSANHNLEKDLCPEITLVGPAIIRSVEALNELDGVDPFKSIELYASTFIKLMLYPVSFFSIDIERLAKMKQKETGKQEEA